MLYLLRIFIILSFILITIEAINCHRNTTRPWEAELYGTNCTGEYCLVYQTNEKHKYQFVKDCYTGLPIKTGCFLNMDSVILCVCNTDYCNTDSLTKSNVTVMDVVHCSMSAVSDVEEEDIGCVFNECYIYNDYIDGEKKGCQYNSEEIISGFEIITAPDNWLYRYPVQGLLYMNGCYNFSRGLGRWSYTCRCNTNDCNAKFTVLKSTKVSCQQTFTDYQSINETWYNETCSGDMCWLQRTKNIYDTREIYPFIYQKGCVSISEKGEYKLIPGYYHLHSMDFWFCNEDMCNESVEMAVLSAEEYNAITGNMSNLPVQNEIIKEKTAPTLSIYCHVFVNIMMVLLCV